MANVENPVYITAYYPKIPASDTAQAVTRGTPVYRDIRISHLTATSPRTCGYIVGLPEMFITKITMDNVNISGVLPG